MRRIMVRRTIVSLTAGFRSWASPRRRRGLGQAEVRSAIRHSGRTAKPRFG